jgi:hypothetical protein
VIAIGLKQLDAGSAYPPLDDPVVPDEDEPVDPGLDGELEFGVGNTEFGLGEPTSSGEPPTLGGNGS